MTSGWTTRLKRPPWIAFLTVVLLFQSGTTQNTTTTTTTLPPMPPVTTFIVNNMAPPHTTFPTLPNVAPTVIPSNTPPQTTMFPRASPPPPPVTTYLPQVLPQTTTTTPAAVPDSISTTLPPILLQPTTVPSTTLPPAIIPTTLYQAKVSNVQSSTLGPIVITNPASNPPGSTPGPPGSTPGPPVPKTGLTSSVTSTSTTQSSSTPEFPEHIQLVTEDDFNLTIGATSLLVYCGDLQTKIAYKVGVAPSRITDVSVLPQPGTDLLVLRFTIQPVPQNCTSGCATVASIVQALRNQESNTATGLIFDDINYNQLLILGPMAFYAWTDSGPCSEQKCQNGGVCDCSTTGIFSCTCNSELYTGALCQDKQGSNRQQLAWLALLVLIIPLAVGIYFIVRLVRERETKVSLEILESEGSSTISSYNEKPPIVETGAANPDGENTIYKTLSTSIALAFTDKTFIKEEEENGVGVVTVDNTATGLY